MNRRETLKALAATTLISGGDSYASAETPELSISLAQWSLHRTFFGSSLDKGWGSWLEALETNPREVLKGTRHPLEFAEIARNDFGIDTVEYVNTFFFDRAEDKKYLSEMAIRADDVGVKSKLIMCDALGMLGAANKDVVNQTIENHKPWIDAAKNLGCSALRVNVYGDGTPDELRLRIIDGLDSLSIVAAQQELDVLVENHGGQSSDAAWLAEIISSVDNVNVGTLPDFGNFRLLPNFQPRRDDDPYYDRYKGVAELMPYARGVSAKSEDFDDNGNEVNTDFFRMIKIVFESGFKGHIGIEYAGSRLSELTGIQATQNLLQKTFVELQRKN